MPTVLSVTLAIGSHRLSQQVQLLAITIQSSRIRIKFPPRIVLVMFGTWIQMNEMKFCFCLHYWEP